MAHSRFILAPVGLGMSGLAFKTCPDNREHMKLGVRKATSQILKIGCRERIEEFLVEMMLSSVVNNLDRVHKLQISIC